MSNELTTTTEYVNDINNAASDLAESLSITIDPLQHAKNLIGDAASRYEETIAKLEEERDHLIEQHNRNMEYYSDQISKNKHALAGLQMSIEIYKRPTEEVLNVKRATESTTSGKEVRMASRRYDDAGRNKVSKAKPVARTPRLQQIPGEVSSISAT